MHVLKESSPKPFAKWETFSCYVDPEETRLRMLAQSALTGGIIGVAPYPTIDQARDILAWYDPKH